MIDLYFDETYENTFNYDVYDGIELWLQENADGRLLASVRKYKGAGVCQAGGDNPHRYERLVFCVKDSLWYLFWIQGTAGYFRGLIYRSKLSCDLRHYMDELFECLVFIFGFLYIFKWMLDFLVKKFHLHTGIFTIEGNQLVVRALFSVRYEKNKIATIIFSCMHSWRIPWAHAGKMLIIMKDGTRSDRSSLTADPSPENSVRSSIPEKISSEP